VQIVDAEPVEHVLGYNCTHETRDFCGQLDTVFEIPELFANAAEITVIIGWFLRMFCEIDTKLAIGVRMNFHKASEQDRQRTQSCSHMKDCRARSPVRRRHGERLVWQRSDIYETVVIFVRHSWLSVLVSPPNALPFSGAGAARAVR
jgi:hypothetical protein